MFAQLILTLPAAFHAPLPKIGPSPESRPDTALAQDAEYEGKLAEAGSDVDKLWQLYGWCKETQRTAEARTVAKKIIELAPDHADARKALNHQFYDGKWFETYTALAKYKREEEQKMKDKGLARFGEEWVPAADLPYLRMKWVKNENGAWENPGRKAQRELDAKRISEGWSQRPEDLTWVGPDEAEKVKAGLWKCGEEWLPLEEANAFHSQPYLWWTIKGEHFLINTTMDRNPSDPRNSLPDWAYWWADQTYANLVRLFGATPAQNPQVTVLRSLEQYNDFAGGKPEKNLPATEASGFSACTYAYLAELMFDPTVQPPEYRGQGVGFWDPSDQNFSYFGPYSVRFAAALSFAEVIDPSLDSISKIIESPGGQPNMGTFWTEKKLPMWLRYGAASYVERFAEDPLAAADKKLEIRNWALQNYKSRFNELQPLSEVFAFAIDGNNRDGSERLIQSAGILVTFILDGKSAPVTEKHQALKSALKSGGDCKAEVAELQAALVAQEAELKKFAGL